MVETYVLYMYYQPNATIISFSNQMYTQCILCFCTSDSLIYIRNAFKKCGVSLRSIVFWIIFMIIVMMIIIITFAGFRDGVHYDADDV